MVLYEIERSKPHITANDEVGHVDMIMYIGMANEYQLITYEVAFRTGTIT